MKLLPRVHATRSLWLAPIVVWLSLLAVACSATPDADVPDGRNMTIEEAGFVSQGKLFEIYDAEADPVVTAVEGTRGEWKATPVWVLDLDVAVTIDDRRQKVRWRMYVGTGADGPTVVDAQEE